MPELRIWAALLLAGAAGCADGLQFKMDVNDKQCLSEDAGSDEVLVHARYNVTSKPSADTRCDAVALPLLLSPPPPLPLLLRLPHHCLSKPGTGQPSTHLPPSTACAMRSAMVV